ncbi:MAG: ribosome silencing factor [Lachnospiraceae bacterium]|nr:ribosome silencing factor [Lachnospiraceae bacterium]
MTDTEKLLQTAFKALDEKKAYDIKVIDISKVSILADYFMIATGSNINQIHAMTDLVEEKLSKEGYHPRAVEGYRLGNWILMDYQDVVIHIFDQESREFYDLERIWTDGEIVEIKDPDQKED